MFLRGRSRKVLHFRLLFFLPQTTFPSSYPVTARCTYTRDCHLNHKTYVAKFQKHFTLVLHLHSHVRKCQKYAVSTVALHEIIITVKVSKVGPTFGMHKLLECMCFTFFPCKFSNFLNYLSSQPMSLIVNITCKIIYI